MWNLVSIRLEIVLVFVQDRCTVCAKRTIGSEIVLDAPDGTPRCRGSVKLEIVRILMQDRCPACAERTIGSEIVWMHPMELLSDVGHVEPRFDPFGDSVSVGAR